MILASFHAPGMMIVFMALLYNSVSAVMAIGPRCFMCVFEMSSGPVDFLGFVCFIACSTSVWVMVMGAVFSFLIFLAIFLCSVFVFHVIGLEYCLLNLFALCSFVVTCLLS